MGLRFLKISVIYFMIAVLIGLVMGILHDFTLTPVHVHLNLLGWVSMALFGIIYCIFPSAAETKLAKAHFWLHNIGVPLMQGALFIILVTGNPGLTIVTIIGSIIVVLGIILYGINILNVKAEQNRINN